MAERKVVFDRIVRIERAQRFGDLYGCGPRHVVPFGKSEVPRELVNVGVHRADQKARRDIPFAEIDPIVRADHPTQKKEQPLRPGPTTNIGKNVSRPATCFVIYQSAREPNRFAQLRHRILKRIAPRKKKRERLSK